MKEYYYRRWKHHCFLFLVALTLLTNGSVWAAVFALYALPAAVISCIVAAAFGLFAATIEYRACDHFHTRYLRSLCDGSPSLERNGPHAGPK